MQKCSKSLEKEINVYGELLSHLRKDFLEYKKLTLEQLKIHIAVQKSITITLGNECEIREEIGRDIKIVFSRLSKLDEILVKHLNYYFELTTNLKENLTKEELQQIRKGLNFIGREVEKWKKNNKDLQKTMEKLFKKWCKLENRFS